MTTITEPTAAPVDVSALGALPPAPPTAPEEKPVKLPADLKIENYSQALRLARRFFGPLVRLYAREFAEDSKLYEVSLPKYVLGVGDDWKMAIEMAMQVVADNEKGEEPTPGLIQERQRNVTTAMRMGLFNSLPNAYDPKERTDVMFGVLGLRDHQLFEVQKLARETVEGPMLFREAAAKDLKQVLMIARERFQTASK